MILGNQTNPKGFILVNYCGGWGYIEYCADLDRELASKIPNKFLILSRSDPEMTGRFEITLFKTLDDLKTERNGKLFHSKDKSGEFPDYSEDSQFINELKNYWIYIVVYKIFNKTFDRWVLNNERAYRELVFLLKMFYGI